MGEVIYAQVLLLDNKIESWKICQSKKNSPYDFKAFWKRERVKDYTIETVIFEEEKTELENGWDFNSYVYEVLAPQWINQWEYADDYRGGKATVKTIEEVIADRKQLSEALGGRYEFIGCLGKN